MSLCAEIDGAMVSIWCFIYTFYVSVFPFSPLSVLCGRSSLLLGADKK